MNLQLVAATEENISSIQALAEVIWNDHYPEIIGQEQVDYMLNRFYSRGAMVEQMRGGQQFYQVFLDGLAVGFAAVEKRGRGLIFSTSYTLVRGFSAGVLGVVFGGCCWIYCQICGRCGCR